jgi:hypothetical protein
MPSDKDSPEFYRKYLRGQELVSGNSGRFRR